MQAFARPWLRSVSRLALACVSTLLALAALDLGYRAQVHRPVFVLDDWRTARIEFLTFGNRVRFDPVLGWAPVEGYETDFYDTLAFGIRRNFDEKEVRTGGILAVGDAFTEGGTQVPDGETWPAHLEYIIRVPVLNAGVAGYAADQIVLRAEQLLPVVRPKTLVVGMFEDVIARAGLSSFGTAKPYFTIEKGKLAFHGPSRGMTNDLPGWQARIRDILGYSAVLDVALSRLAPSYWYGKAGEQVSQPANNDPVAVTCALLERLKRRTDADRVHLLLLLQHGRASVAGRMEPAEDARKVGECAASLAIEVIDQFASLRAVALANPTAMDDLYVQGGYGQMSADGNWRTAELLAGALDR